MATNHHVSDEKRELGDVQENTSEIEAVSKDGDIRPKFGTRFLTNSQNVFQHNAWDNVVWDDEQEAQAKSVTEKHVMDAMSEEKKDELESGADGYWDKFYGQHQNRFFKDRHWLFTEFPELYASVPVSAAECAVTSDLNPECDGTLQSQSKLADSIPGNGSPCDPSNEIRDSIESMVYKDPETDHTSHSLMHTGRSIRFLEVGCGVGNTVFPLLNTNKNPELMVYCCDFSSTAVQILKEHPDYDESRCCAFVWDITQENPRVPIEPGSLDIIIMIFVLSALSPEKMQGAVDRLASYLRPGGTLLFRDYGRYDLAQLRFKKGRCISENFYVRGDGTRVYFFTQDELDSMFSRAGLSKKENLVDRRLQVNRGKQLKMYRVWIQCKYMKSTQKQSGIES